jgi:hypothetical protein
MRVTIGERLGLFIGKHVIHQRKPLPDEAVPDHVEPETAGPVLSFWSTESSTLPMGYPVKREMIEGEPPRVRGEMLWLHKTAPTLIIEGRPMLSPEEHAAGRRR